MPKTPTAKPKKKDAPASKKGERPVEHDKLEVLRFWTDDNDPDAKGPMTQDIMRGILGWEEETEEVKFGDSFLFKDRRGNKPAGAHIRQ